MSSNPLGDSYDDQPPVPPSKSGMGSKFAQAFRKRTAEEKDAKRRNKNAGVTRSKTVGSRMDVIDKLDVSGFHGSSMFHHDSPYDACTPHANRSERRAPVNAFDPNAENLAAMSLNGNGTHGGSMSADSKVRPSGQGARSHRSFTSPLPTLPMNGAASTSAVNVPTPNVENYGAYGDTASVTTDSTADLEGDRVHRHRPSASRTVSNPMRDMWGVNEDEPWQDFASPKSKERARRKAQQEKNGMLHPYGAAGSADATPSAASSVLDMETLMTGKTAEERRAMETGGSPDIAGVSPFPEPDYDSGNNAVSPLGRNKSILRRIKSARQNPNVPPPGPDDEGVEMAGRASTRRYGPHAHRNSPPTSSTDRADWGSLTSPGLGVGAGSTSLGRNGTRKPRRDRELGTPQSTTSGDAYFDTKLRSPTDERPGGVSPNEQGGSGANLGRSTSIFGRFSRKKSYQ